MGTVDDKHGMEPRRNLLKIIETLETELSVFGSSEETSFLLEQPDQLISTFFSKRSDIKRTAMTTQIKNVNTLIARIKQELQAFKNIARN